MLDTVLEVSWTADQRHLVAAGGDQALRMWEISSGRVRHTLTGHTGKVLHNPASLYMPYLAFLKQLYKCNIYVAGSQAAYGWWRSDHGILLLSTHNCLLHVALRVAVGWGL